MKYKKGKKAIVTGDRDSKSVGYHSLEIGTKVTLVRENVREGYYGCIASNGRTTAVHKDDLKPKKNKLKKRVKELESYIDTLKHSLKDLKEEAIPKFSEIKQEDLPEGCKIVTPKSTVENPTPHEQIINECKEVKEEILKAGIVVEMPDKTLEKRIGELGVANPIVRELGSGDVRVCGDLGYESIGITFFSREPVEIVEKVKQIIEILK